MNRFVNRVAVVGVTLAVVAGVAGAARAADTQYQTVQCRCPVGALILPANGVARAAKEDARGGNVGVSNAENRGSQGRLEQAGDRCRPARRAGRSRMRRQESAGGRRRASWTCRVSRAAIASGSWCTEYSGREHGDQRQTAPAATWSLRRRYSVLLCTSSQ